MARKTVKKAPVAKIKRNATFKALCVTVSPVAIMAGKR